MDDERKAAMLEERARVSAAINVRGPQRRRRRDPGDIPTMRAAIQSMCSECMGHGDDLGDVNNKLGSIANQIRNCDSPKCWLYPWRNGKLDKSLIEKS